MDFSQGMISAPLCPPPLQSQVCRVVVDAARAAGLRVALVRHPMPYGRLQDMVVQRFATGAQRAGAGVDRHGPIAGGTTGPRDLAPAWAC
jgi:hypothetical protein